MRLKNKMVVIIAIISMLTLLFASCSSKETTVDKKVDSSDKKVKVITTLFPQYDFVREIAGDKVDVTLLVKPGVETHSYEPTSKDIMEINKADMFVYTGEYMETWAKDILDSLTNDKLKVTDVSTGITLDKGEDDHDEDHEDEKEHASEEKHDEEGHNHEYDPHIWTNPEYAKIMVDNILKDLIKVDPKNEKYYTENANKYKNELTSVSEELRKAVKEGKRDEIIYGGRFAMHYFTEEYGIKYKSAYEGCSTESEPSAEVISSIIKEIKEKNIPVVYYEELVEPKIARAISEEAGIEMLLLHTCHNISDKDMKSGVTYLSLMKQNLENLKKGLN